MAAGNPQFLRSPSSLAVELLRAEFSVRQSYWYSWYWADQSYNVVLTRKSLTWNNCMEPTDTVSVRLSKVLCAHCEKSVEANTNLDIHHVVTTNYVKTIKTTSFRGPTLQCEEWCKAISDEVSRNRPNRPKRLLVFVNPRSGNGRGLEVYQNTVEPIFNMCGVHVDLRVISKPKEPEDTLQSFDLFSVDGIVISGGDGTFIELVNGMVKRNAKVALQNLDNPDVQPNRLTVPVGIIPSGSGNMNVASIHGTSDVTTAVISIIQGDVIHKDVASVRSDGEFLSFSSILTGGGFLRDLTHYSEKVRWMGPIRYLVVRLLAARYAYRAIDVEIEFLNAATKMKAPSTPAGHPVVDVQSNNTESEPTEKPNIDADGSSEKWSYINPRSGWEKIRGKFVQAICFVLDMNGVQKRRVSNSGHMLIYTQNDGPFMANMKAFAAIWKKDDNAYTLENVFARKATVIHVKAMGEWADNPDSLNITIDGELFTLNVPEYELSLHPKLVTIYGKDIIPKIPR